jgi:hypothetical protein
LKLLNPAGAKAGIKSMLSRGKSVNILQTVIGVRKAAGDLLTNFRQYTLGFPMNDAERQGGITVLGELFQHAVASAKLLGVKVPPAQRRIKPKNTPTYLLIDIDRLANEMLTAIFAVMQAKITGTKDVVGKDKDGKPVTRQVSVYTIPELNAEKIGADLSNLLHTAYEFVWAVYEYPAANIFQNRIQTLTSAYPKGFFDAPAKQPGKGPVKKAAKKDGIVEPIAKATAKGKKGPVVTPKVEPIQAKEAAKS